MKIVVNQVEFETDLSPPVIKKKNVLDGILITTYCLNFISKRIGHVQTHSLFHTMWLKIWKYADDGGMIPRAHILEKYS